MKQTKRWIMAFATVYSFEFLRYQTFAKFAAPKFPQTTRVHNIFIGTGIIGGSLYYLMVCMPLSRGAEYSSHMNLGIIEKSMFFV